MTKRSLPIDFFFKVLIRGVGNWTYSVAAKQNPRHWTKLYDYLEDQVPNSHPTELVIPELFDQLLEQSQNRNAKLRNLRYFTWFAIIIGILLSAMTFSATISFQSWFLLPFITASVSVYVIAANLNSRSELDTDMFAKSLTSEKRKNATRFIELLETKIFPKYDFAVRNKAGDFLILPKHLVRAENIFLFIFGEEKHRAAIPYHGPYPKGPLFISLMKPTAFSRPKGEVLDYLKNKSRVQAIYKLVESYEGMDPVSPSKKLIKPRKRWMDAQKILLDDFDLWLKIESRSTSEKARNEFEKRLNCALLGTKKGKIVSVHYKEFITGKNRSFRNWLFELLEILNSK